MVSGLDKVTEAEYSAIRSACEFLPPPTIDPRRTNYVQNLLLTVLDFMMLHSVIVKAIKHFKKCHFDKGIKDHHSLRGLLESYPDDKAAAKALWDNRHWMRIRHLRNLLRFFEDRGVTDHESLKKWAQTSDFSRDFKGKVPGLALAIYKWLTIRLGVDTVKPDTHVHRFLQNVGKRKFSNREVIAILEKVAGEIGREAHKLDLSIFEHQTGARTKIGGDWE